MQYFARFRYSISCVTLALCCSVGPSVIVLADSYRDVVAELPALAPGQGRVFFFGRNSAFLFKPKISINTEVLDTPYGKNIFYFIDRPAGAYSLAVDGEASLSFELQSGESKYIAMSSGRPRNPKDGLFEPESLRWVLKLRLMSAQHAEAVMRNMRWKN